MSKCRVSLQFDMEFGDEAQAKGFAAASMNRRVQQIEAQGVRGATSRGESPEVAIHGAAQATQAAAAMIALELLRRGASTLPWLVISEVDVMSEPTVP
jgi:hypothetical protein